MLNPAERIRAVLQHPESVQLRPTRRVMQSAIPGSERPRVTVVIDEQNLAALASPVIELPLPKAAYSSSAVAGKSGSI